MHTKKNRHSEERRVTVRRPYTCPVSFTALGNSHNLPGNVEKPAEAVDISDYGMRIRTATSSLREGFMLRVQIPVTGSKSVIPVFAEIRWVRGKKPDYYHAGLRFL
jgi:hypothetical protein